MADHKILIVLAVFEYRDHVDPLTFPRHLSSWSWMYQSYPQTWAPQTPSFYSHSDWALSVTVHTSVSWSQGLKPFASGLGLFCRSVLTSSPCKFHDPCSSSSFLLLLSHLILVPEWSNSPTTPSIKLSSRQNTADYFSSK